MKSVEIELGENKLVLETGFLAKQADGSVVARYGNTILLATVTASKESKEGGDFLPLTVDYIEKAYSAGKIPGGFLKRESKQSEKEILISRLTDRSLRPMFVKGYSSETQCIIQVLSYGEENVSDLLSIIAASAAFVVSDIPLESSVSAVRVGLIDNEMILNPTVSELDYSDLNLIVAGTAGEIIMVEGSSYEISEEAMLNAINFAHEAIKKICAIQDELAALAGKPKRGVVVREVNTELVRLVKDYVMDKINPAIRIPDKLKRQAALDVIMDDAGRHIASEHLSETITESVVDRDVPEIFYEIEKDIMRDLIINKSIRVDGRSPEQIRPINCVVGLLPMVHGSAVFTRGETQSLSTVTLGTSSDEQRIDALEGDSYQSFMLHYNFPPFSVGEVKRLGSPGRREIGHGALAAKGIRPIIPSSETFPYTIRVVSDILESNGSSSMATVCGATLALMDAGVPIKDAVAGIAMGLVKEGDKYVVLTDILGVEDHLGDMDFKVTGTAHGITAFQMDAKIKGIPKEIMKSALEQARVGRVFILDKILETISVHRESLSPNAPRIQQIKINPEKVRDVIGPGGKIIRSITDQTGAKIDVNDEGMVSIASKNEDSLNKAIEIIMGIVEEPEIGKIYRGTVQKIMDFGAFIQIMPGTDGLLHISQISDKRIAKVTDVLSEGDVVYVKVIDIDKSGKIKLSRKEVPQEPAVQ